MLPVRTVMVYHTTHMSSRRAAALRREACKGFLRWGPSFRQRSTWGWMQRKGRNRLRHHLTSAMPGCSGGSSSVHSPPDRCAYIGIPGNPHHAQ